jgi:hypothetical protein
MRRRGIAIHSSICGRVVCAVRTRKAHAASTYIIQSVTRAHGAPYICQSDPEFVEGDESAVERAKSKSKSRSFATAQDDRLPPPVGGRQDAAKRLLAAKTNIRLANVMLLPMGWGWNVRGCTDMISFQLPWQIPKLPFCKGGEFLGLLLFRRDYIWFSHLQRAIT